MDEHISTIGTPIENPKTHNGTPTKHPKNKHTVTLLHVYNLDMKFPLENGKAENDNAADVNHDDTDSVNIPVSENHVDVSDVTSADESVNRYDKCPCKILRKHGEFFNWRKTVLSP